MFDEDEIEAIETLHNATLNKGIIVAKANNMNLSKFKTEINKGLLTTNDEDQWTFDYESYLGSISGGIYVTPTEWGEEYYMDRWLNN